MVEICTIEPIVGKLEEVQGDDRGQMGRTRMEEQELTADVIKNKDAIGRKRRKGKGGEGGR